jgi:hypothetical protein
MLIKSRRGRFQFSVAILLLLMLMVAVAMGLWKMFSGDPASTLPPKLGAERGAVRVWIPTLREDHMHVAAGSRLDVTVFIDGLETVKQPLRYKLAHEAPIVPGSGHTDVEHTAMNANMRPHIKEPESIQFDERGTHLIRYGLVDQNDEWWVSTEIHVEVP